MLYVTFHAMKIIYALIKIFYVWSRYSAAFYFKIIFKILPAPWICCIPNVGSCKVGIACLKSTLTRIRG